MCYAIIFNVYMCMIIYNITELFINYIQFLGLPWDIAIQHLIQYINGEYTIKQLSKVVEMDTDILKRSLQILLYYHCIFITDLFQFDNMYAIEPLGLKVIKYVSGLTILEGERDASCIGESCNNNNSNNTTNNTTTSSNTTSNSIANCDYDALISDIQIYCANTIDKLPSKLDIIYALLLFQRNNSVKDICMEYTSRTHVYNQCLRYIHIRRFIEVMSDKCLIRRIYVYPIYVLPEATVSNISTNTNTNNRNDIYSSYYTGLYHQDQLHNMSIHYISNSHHPNKTINNNNNNTNTITNNTIEMDVNKNVNKSVPYVEYIIYK